MKTRQKIILGLAAVLILLGFVGETNRAQMWLRGSAKPNETPFEADDRYMGAGLAPIFYLIAPGVIIGAVGVMDASLSKRRKLRRNQIG